MPFRSAGLMSSITESSCVLVSTPVTPAPVDMYTCRSSSVGVSRGFRVGLGVPGAMK